MNKTTLITVTFCRHNASTISGINRIWWNYYNLFLVAKKYNQRAKFGPNDKRLAFVVREPIENGKQSILCVWIHLWLGIITINWILTINLLNIVGIFSAKFKQGFCERWYIELIIYNKYLATIVHCVLCRYNFY